MKKKPSLLLTHIIPPFPFKPRVLPIERVDGGRVETTFCCLPNPTRGQALGSGYLGSPRGALGGRLLTLIL